MTNGGIENVVTTSTAFEEEEETLYQMDRQSQGKWNMR